MMKLRAWEMEPGDRIMGTGLVVTGTRFYGMGDLGSERERQQYEITFANGRTMIVDAEYRGNVIR